MEALRKIVPGSALKPLFSLPRSSDELKYEVIVLPYGSDNDPHDTEKRESLTAFLRGALGDADFDCTRKQTSERGTPVEVFN
jgi:hypothetical protein